MNVIAKEIKSTSPEEARKYAEEVVGNYGTARIILNLADQVEELTKERDFLAMTNKDLSEAMNRYQQLQQAAKLALDASLQVYATCDWYGDDGREAIGALSEAINTLRQAGVQ